MVEVTEKMIEAGVEAYNHGLGVYHLREILADIYTAMHSAREVDAQAIGQIKHGLIAARDRLNRAIEELIDSEVAAIAAMGEGDVR